MSTLYTSKHLAIELGITQKRLLEILPWAPIRTWKAGELFRFEIADLELNSLRNALRPLPKQPTRERVKKSGGRTRRATSLNATRDAVRSTLSSEVQGGGIWSAWAPPTEAITGEDLENMHVQDHGFPTEDCPRCTIEIITHKHSDDPDGWNPEPVKEGHE